MPGKAKVDEIRKPKLVTNGAARAPIRVILCAQKAMFYGYILAKSGPRGRLKKGPKQRKTRSPPKFWYFEFVAKRFTITWFSGS